MHMDVHTYICLYAIHSHKYASILVAWVNLAKIHTYVCTYLDLYTH